MNNFLSLLKSAKVSLLWFAATFAISCFLIASLHGYRVQEQIDIQKKGLQLSAIRAANNQRGLDLEMMQQKAGEYLLLQRIGFIGEADRNGWIERLENIYSDTNLPATLHYALAPPKSFNAGPGSFLNGIQHHDLTLEVSGIDDEEFLNFMDRLSANWQVPYLVRGCQISREPEARLRVKCDMQIYNLPVKVVP